MKLFMTEVLVPDFDVALAWYTEQLGMLVERLDRPNQFALLHGPADKSHRIALKGNTERRGFRLHFEVDDLDRELERHAGDFDVKRSEEGYRRAILGDPSGNEIVLFEWKSSRDSFRS